MKTLIKLLFLGTIANMAVKIYRRQQRLDRELPGNRRQRRTLEHVGDTSAVSGDPVGGRSRVGALRP